MASGVRDLGVSLGAKISGLLLTVATQACLAWFLGPEGRGSYAVCLVYATVLSVVFLIGCDTAVVYFVASKRFTLSEGVIYGFLYGMIGSCVAVIVGLILMQFDLTFFEKATPTAFYLSLALIPALLFSLMYVNLFTSVREFGLYAIMTVLNVALILAFTVLFVWSFEWGVNGAVLANLAGCVITVLACVLSFQWKYGLTWQRPAIQKFLRMVGYGARYHVGKLSNLMNMQIGTIILALFATPVDIGFFAVASQLTFKTMMIPDALTAVLIPRVAGDERGKRELVAQCSRLTAIVCGFLLLVIAVFAKPIIIVLFSPAFLPAVSLVQILAVGTFFRCTCKVFVPYLIGTDHPGLGSIAVAVGMAINVVMLWLLLPLIGLAGAAIAVMASYLVSSAILAVAFSKLSSLRLREIWRFRRADWALMYNAIGSAASTTCAILKNFRTESVK